MIVIIILLLIINIGGVWLSIYSKRKFAKQRKQLYNQIQQKVEEEFITTRKKELEENLLIKSAKNREIAELQHKNFVARFQEQETYLRGTITTLQGIIEQLEQRKCEQTQFLDETICARKEGINAEIEAFKEVQTQKAWNAISAETDAMQKFAEEGVNRMWDEFAQNAQDMQTELERLKAELEEYKKKQQAVNEAILRQRELDEKQDFYRVCLSDFTIEDINLLQEIRQKLHTSESLNKLIYDVYVSKQVQEMVKRVLQGTAPSGIYKITRLKTGEIYIGKSVNVKDRWQQHCKTVFGAGTIAHSILHTTMQKDGIQNFTFELLEEVPKEKLTEREKYWINFYGSRDYGLNERCG